MPWSQTLIIFDIFVSKYPNFPHIVSMAIHMSMIHTRMDLYLGIAICVVPCLL